MLNRSGDTGYGAARGRGVFAVLGAAALLLVVGFGAGCEYKADTIDDTKPLAETNRLELRVDDFKEDGVKVRIDNGDEIRKIYRSWCTIIAPVDAPYKRLVIYGDPMNDDLDEAFRRPGSRVIIRFPYEEDIEQRAYNTLDEPGLKANKIMSVEVLELGEKKVYPERQIPER